MVVNLSFQGLVGIGLYLLVGPTLIMLNKYILSSLKFEFPIFVASLGMTTSCIIVRLGHYFNLIMIRKEIKNLVTWKFFIYRIGTIGLLQSLTLNFGNRVYIYLTVSLIQMLKSFTPVIIMCVLFATRQEKPTIKFVGSILLLSVGTSITTTGVTSQDWNIPGFIYMFLAEFIEAVKLALSQKLLQGIEVSNNNNNNNNNVERDEESLRFLNNNDNEKNNKINVKFTVFEGLYYYTPCAIFWMYLVAIPVELSKFNENFSENIKIILNNFALFILAGLLGFGCNLAAWMITGVISGLYLKALAVFRNFALVCVNILFFQEIVTKQQFFGYVISLVGFFYYSYLKLNKKK